MRRKALRALLALGALLVVTGAPAQDGGRGLVTVEPGQIASAPLFAAGYLDLDDRPARFALPGGRPTIVNFWARWCGPCKTEIPELVALRGREPGIEVVGINIESDVAAVREFARAYDIDYPTLVARESGLGLMRALGNKRAGLPFTVALDREGRVVALRLGALNRADIDSVVGLLRR